MGERGKAAQQALRTQIRVELAVRGLNQSQLARLAGLTTSAISRYLLDSYDRDIPYPVVVDIAHGLGLGVGELIHRADHRAYGDSDSDR